MPVTAKHTEYKTGRLPKRDSTDGITSKTVPTPYAATMNYTTATIYDTKL
jgi:hypothetical protein